MKKQILYCITVSVLFLFIGRLTASAVTGDYLTTVQIPFDFQVNDKLLPAGEYVIRRDPQNPQILLIQCPDKNIGITVHTILHSLSERPGKTSLVFKKYDDKHFLTEVKMLGLGEGYTLIKSKAERQLVQEVKATTIRVVSNSVTTNN